MPNMDAHHQLIWMHITECYPSSNNTDTQCRIGKNHTFQVSGWTILKASSFIFGMNLVGGWVTNPFEKYYIVKLDHETPRIGVKNPKIFELPPPRNSSKDSWNSTPPT